MMITHPKVLKRRQVYGHRSQAEYLRQLSERAQPDLESWFDEPATGSAPTPTEEQPIEKNEGKTKGSVVGLIVLAFVFWPAAILYFLMRRWR